MAPEILVSCPCLNWWRSLGLHFYFLCFSHNKSLMYTDKIWVGWVLGSFNNQKITIFVQKRAKTSIFGYINSVFINMWQQGTPPCSYFVENFKIFQMTPIKAMFKAYWGTGNEKTCIFLPIFGHFFGAIGIPLF